MLPFLVLLAINGYLLMKTPGSTGSPSPSKKGGEGEYKVFGVMSCGWTRKQLDYFKQKKMNHAFIDCEKEPEKCKGMKGFPVVELPSGERRTGFSEY